MNPAWARYVSVAVLLVAVGPGPVRAEDRQLDRTRKDLESVQSRIESTASALEDKQQAARRLLRQLDEVERRLQQAARKVRDSETRLQALKVEIGGEETAVQQGRQQIRGLEGQLNKRLTALYKGGDSPILKMLFSSQSPAELLENYTFMQRLVVHDRELLAAYRKAVAGNEARLARLAGLREDREQAFQQQTAEEVRLRQASSEKSRLLKQVRQDEASLAVLLAELEERAARLSALVNKLESAKAEAYTGEAGAFRAQKGKLDWPVRGQIRTRFGPGVHAEFGTRYDSHGIEIRVSDQQPIQSVWDGQVVFANAFRGYGNLLIVDHGAGFYSLYAQASRLLKEVGARVSRGEPVAVSGFEGGDTVYFEIRQGGSPEDPLTWLRNRP